MGTIIWQPGLFTRQDDTALVSRGGRWYRVPAWIWLEWEAVRNNEAGIRGIIRHWQNGLLMRYRRPDTEDEALDNLEDDANALGRYYANPQNTTWYRNLDGISRFVLNYDQKLMVERPHLTQWDRYELLAERMEKHFKVGFSSRMVQGYLRDATDMLRIIAQRQRLRSLKRLVTAVLEVDILADTG